MKFEVVLSSCQCNRTQFSMTPLRSEKSLHPPNDTWSKDKTQIPSNQKHAGRTTASPKRMTFCLTQSVIHPLTQVGHILLPPGLIRWIMRREAQLIWLMENFPPSCKSTGVIPFIPHTVWSSPCIADTTPKNVCGRRKTKRQILFVLYFRE